MGIVLTWKMVATNGTTYFGPGVNVPFWSVQIARVERSRFFFPGPYLYLVFLFIVASDFVTEFCL